MFVSARGASTAADHGLRELPKFVGHVRNQTVRAGNDVILACQVKSLGNYKARMHASRARKSESAATSHCTVASDRFT